MSFLEKTKENINELLHDHTHFTARWLHVLHKYAKISEEYSALAFVSVLSLYLLFGSRAQLVSNAVLVVTLVLLSYVYPRERPLNSELLITWTIFAIMSLGDSSLDTRIPAYYPLKLLLHLLLFLRPFQLAKRIDDKLKSIEYEAQKTQYGDANIEKLHELEKVSKRKSPPPEKPPELTPPNP